MAEEFSLNGVTEEKWKAILVFVSPDKVRPPKIHWPRIIIQMRRKSASEQFALPKGQLWADFSRKTRQLIYLSKLTQRKLENELSSYLFSSPFEQRSYCAKKWNQICSFIIRCTLADFSFFYRWCQAKLDQLTWLVASYTQRTTLTTTRHDEKHPEVEFMRFQPTTSFLVRKKRKQQ